jgi:hypothetical protein
MWAIVRRAVVPAALVIGGLASLIYGAIFRSMPVLEERETQTTIEVPADFLPLPPSGAAGPDWSPFPGGSPFAAPKMTKKTVTRIDEVTINVSEPALMSDVSVGGVAMLKTGELKRTYSGDKGPALCPS